MASDIFNQAPHRIRLYRGHQGAQDAAQQGHILVVIDTLSFSTAAITAVHRGGIVFPCAKTEDPIAFAQKHNAEPAVGRNDVPHKGRFSLSPQTLDMDLTDTRIVLSSPNGATCSRYGRDVPYLFVGSLINAKAIANVLTHLLQTTNHTIVLLACGERWQTPNVDGDLRWALEDDLGAGAILSHLNGDKSPEAIAVEGTFRAVQPHLTETLQNCASGRELADRGFLHDVQFAAQRDKFATVPYMFQEHLKRFNVPA